MLIVTFLATLFLQLEVSIRRRPYLILIFLNDFTNDPPEEGADNDYLVWKDAYITTLREAPEPGTYLLLALAFAALMFYRRRVAI